MIRLSVPLSSAPRSIVIELPVEVTAPPVETESEPSFVSIRIVPLAVTVPPIVTVSSPSDVVRLIVEAVMSPVTPNVVRPAPVSVTLSAFPASSVPPKVAASVALSPTPRSMLRSFSARTRPPMLMVSEPVLEVMVMSVFAHREYSCEVSTTVPAVVVVAIPPATVTTASPASNAPIAAIVIASSAAFEMIEIPPVSAMT